MAETTVQVLVRRDGLRLRLYLAANNRLICTVDLKDKLKLSDEEAQQLLEQLDGRDSKAQEEAEA